MAAFFFFFEDYFDRILVQLPVNFCVWKMGGGTLFLFKLCLSPSRTTKSSQSKANLQSSEDSSQAKTGLIYITGCEFQQLSDRRPDTLLHSARCL